jgi:integrase
MKTKIKMILRTDLPLKHGQFRIDARVQYCGKQYKFPTEKKISFLHWDKVQGRVLNTSKEASLINKYLSSLQALFDKYIASKEALDEEISIDEIRDLLKGKESNKHQSNKILIEEVFNKYIFKLKTDNRSKNTIRNMESAKKVICEFAEKKYIHSATISKINFNFMEDLKIYLKEKRGNTEASINKRLRNIRAVIKYAIKLGYVIEDPFKNMSIKESKPKKIYLNKDLYDKFKAFELTGNFPLGMSLSKQLFIFSCETGLRYSDIMDLKWEHIWANRVAIKKYQVKTKNEVFVPLSDLAQSIIVTVGDKSSSTYVFPRMTNQAINRCLKEIADLAKIEKHITFHVGRHTFASTLGAKFTNSRVMKLLGDTDPTMANVYINMDDADLLNEMQGLWGNVTA